MDLTGNDPDPTNAVNDPSGEAKRAAAFTITAGTLYGLGKAGVSIFGEPLANVLGNLKNMATNTAESAQESADAGSDIEVF